jgi:hypothetical protein
MNLKTFKKLKTALGIWVIILISLIATSSFASDDIVLPVSDAKKIVVELEKTSLYAQQIQLLEKANEQLIEQLKILQDQNKLLSEQIRLKQEQLDLSIKELDNQKKVYEDKLRVSEENKPTFLDKLKIGVGGASIGVVVTLLAIIAL